MTTHSVSNKYADARREAENIVRFDRAELVAEGEANPSGAADCIHSFAEWILALLADLDTANARIKELENRPRGIGDGDIVAALNERDEYKAMCEWLAKQWKLACESDDLPCHVCPFANLGAPATCQSVEAMLDVAAREAVQHG